MMQGGKIMRRSFGWSVIAILAILLTPVAVAVALPTSTAHAAAAAPDVVYDDEIIVLTNTGQIRVDDPYIPTGVASAAWNSGSDTGYTRVAAGDFNGDGDAEIVAAKGSTIKVFDPIVQPSSQQVSYEVSLGSGRNVQLLATGDFDGDSKDEFAVVHADSGTNILAALRVYDGGANATSSQWSLVNSAQYGMMWEDMAAGDFNGDNIDDLALVRNPSSESKLVGVWNVSTWAWLARGYYNFSWLAVAGGNFSSSRSGDEIFLTRADVLGYYPSALFLKISGSGFADLESNINSAYKYFPYFTSIAAGDLNGDGDDEALLLRDPQANNPSLLMLNPLGSGVGSDNEFKQTIGYGSNAWRSVRAGDVDGDGRDEPVVLRADRYRIYTQPEADDTFIDVTGSFYTTGATDNLPIMAVANVDGAGIIPGPTLSVTPLTLNFSLDYGAASPVKQLSIANVGTGSSFQWKAEVESGSPWLLIDGQQGLKTGGTPGQVNISVNSVAAGLGTKQGTIKISAVDPSVLNSPRYVTVSLTVTDPGFVVYPSQIHIWQAPDATTVTRTIQIWRPTASTGWVATALPLDAAAGLEEKLTTGEAEVTADGLVIDGVQVQPPTWLVFTPDSGTTPGVMTVSVQTNTPGWHRGVIVIAATDPTVTTNRVRYVTVNAFVGEFYPSFLPLMSK